MESKKSQADRRIVDYLPLRASRKVRLAVPRVYQLFPRGEIIGESLRDRHTGPREVIKYTRKKFFLEFESPPNPPGGMEKERAARADPMNGSRGVQKRRIKGMQMRGEGA